MNTTEKKELEKQLRQMLRNHPTLLEGYGMFHDRLRVQPWDRLEPEAVLEILRAPDPLRQLRLEARRYYGRTRQHYLWDLEHLVLTKPEEISPEDRETVQEMLWHLVHLENPEEEFLEQEIRTDLALQPGSRTDLTQTPGETGRRLLGWLAQGTGNCTIPRAWEEELIWETGTDTLVLVLVRMTLNDLISLQILRNDLNRNSPLQTLDQKNFGGITLRAGTKWGLYGARGGSIRQSLEQNLEVPVDCIAWVLPDGCKELDGLEAWDALPEDWNRDAMPIVWDADGWPVL